MAARRQHRVIQRLAWFVAGAVTLLMGAGCSDERLQEVLSDTEVVTVAAMVVAADDISTEQVVLQFPNCLDAKALAIHVLVTRVKENRLDDVWKIRADPDHAQRLDEVTLGVVPDGYEVVERFLPDALEGGEISVAVVTDSDVSALVFGAFTLELLRSAGPDEVVIGSRTMTLEEFHQGSICPSDDGRST